MPSPKTFQIRIDSILGGHSLSTNFAAGNQFRSSLGINPARPISDDVNSNIGLIASGFLRTVASSSIATTTGNIMWIESNPKDLNIYVYGYDGSAYTFSGQNHTFTALNDGGSLSNSTGNGMAYYDNYIYFAKNTTVARYGPLNGASVFDGDYWAGTLGKTALSNSVLPTLNTLGVAGPSMPNHVMHRHSDGKLYFADSVGGQGYLHVISTNKTTVEGDTDNGSTYQKLAFGYGLYITAIESYGSSLVIALFEGLSNSNPTYYTRGTRAKLAFWDTTSQNFNSITWVEFPDMVISALKNVDGILYIASGQLVPTT